MERQNTRGIIDAQSRILEELLGKTAFKDGLRSLLRNIDPENSPKLIRALMGKDIEVPLAIVSALPAIANCFIRIADELLVEVRGKFPPPLLAGFVASLLDEIDKEALARAVANSRGLAEDLTPVFQAAMKALEEGKKIGEGT